VTVKRCNLRRKHNDLTFLEVLDGRMDELESDQLEAALFEPSDDLSQQPTLDAVGLQDNHI
jgi:hypothetical protein